MKLKKILSVVIAMAMTTTFSAVNVSAEDEVKTAEITIDGNFSETLNFSDISEEDGWRGIDWNLAAHDPEGNGNDRSADILAAIEEETGDVTQHWLVQVKDMTVNYTVNVSSSRNDEDITFEVSPFVGGFEEKDTEPWVETLFEEAVYSTVSKTKTHEGTVSAAEVIGDANNTGAKTISDIHTMGVGVGMWTDNPEDTLTFTIDSITLSVEYTLEPKPVGLPAITKPVTYDQIKNAEYITVVAQPALNGECGHDAHINEETGVDEGEGKQYCPWVDASFHKKDENGELSWPAYVVPYSQATFNADGSEAIFVFDVSKIPNDIGNFEEGEEYILAVWQVTSYDYGITESSSSGGSSSGGSSSGGSSSGGSSSSSSSSTTKEPEKTEAAEIVVEKALEEAKENSTVEIKVNTEETKVTAEIFLEAKEKNITIEISLGNGVTWKIDASDITEEAANVDINVEINTNNIPETKVKEIAKDNDSMQISLAHNGEFGFKADISIPVDKKHNGKEANLFHYTKDKKYQYMGRAKVNGGCVTMPFVHASEYIIVFTDEPMVDDLSAGESIKVEEKML